MQSLPRDVEVPAPSATAALVERGEELRVLGEDLALAFAGAGRMVVLEGPPGIGKSALLAEALARARAGGMHILAVTAARSERDLPFAIAGRLRLAPEQEGRGADTEVAVLDHLLGELLRQASQRPLVLAIDDAQWSDVASLRFVAYAARRIERAPVLVVLAHRAEEPGATALDTMLSSCAHRVLRLGAQRRRHRIAPAPPARRPGRSVRPCRPARTTTCP